jgi:IrrE N-terminal-like domain
MTAPPGTTQALIDRLVRETGAVDAVAAIRQKAIQAIDSFVQSFGEPETLPLDLPTLASFLGIKLSGTAPAFSPDAELAPDGTGGVEMRVNPDRPETRIRFSIGHEITHTFFPDHSSHVWPRADSRYRDLSNPNDYLEMLCDVGAAELVFPRLWFVKDAAQVASAAGLIELANRYKASRHATVRRFAELHAEPMAAVFFTWKLKPTQKDVVGRPDQVNLFGVTPEEEIRDALRLRIDYAIASRPFGDAGHFLPRDKSVENDGPLYEAARSGQPRDGECHLDLGQAAGTYRVHALPLWTPAEELGPAGENAVAAVIRPLTVRKPKKKVAATGVSLFD